MTRSICTLLGVFSIVALSASTLPQQPMRDGASAAVRTVGTGIIAGVVTLGDDAETPVRRAVVTLADADGSQTLAAISGEDGRFTIERVPAGRYTLGAAKPAHLTVAYGARRPGRRGTVVIISDDQHLDNLTLTLPRGAVLAGRVTLPDGQSVPNVQMAAVPFWLATAGGTPTADAREFRTDDLGEFRLFGLPPDTYVVAALPSFGRGAVERIPDETISTLLRQLQQPDRASAGTVVSSVTVAYAPTYFPGTPSVADAMRITVAAGQIREDLMFSITAVPAATLRGRVVGIDGLPLQAVALSLEAIGPAFPATARMNSQIGSPTPGGEFQVAGVSPGLYRLKARAGGVTLASDGKTSIRTTAQTQYAVTEVRVWGHDIDGIVLTLQEGHRFTGTLTTDDSAAPLSLAGAAVIVQPITAGPPDTFAGVLTPGVRTWEAPVDNQGRFAVTGLEPFDYEILVTLPPTIANAGWHLDSVRYGGRDLRDAPLTFAVGSLEGVEVRLTTRSTELIGRLTTELGSPATDFFIVAFPSDRALWHAASPRVLLMRPAVDGRFGTSDLPHGTYRLAALTDVEDHELRQAEFLESIYDASIEITVAEGHRTRQDIRIGRVPE